MLFFFFFFFFQAEDGIRDATVTGVQTCALPISHGAGGRLVGLAAAASGHGNAGGQERSEDRTGTTHGAQPPRTPGACWSPTLPIVAGAGHESRSGGCRPHPRSTSITSRSGKRPARPCRRGPG